MKVTFVSLVIATLLAGSAGAADPVPSPGEKLVDDVLSAVGLEAKPVPPPGYKLVWSDEFHGPKLDPAKWDTQVGPRKSGNNAAEAATVTNGMLVITTFTADGKHYTGFVWSKRKYEARYGYYEARIAFHDTPGQWSAFWLQTPTMGQPLGDPAKAGTEIDVVEHRARDTQGHDISNMYVMNLHWDGYEKGVHKIIGGKTKDPAGRTPLQGEWHTYGLLWTPERYTFYLDGAEQWQTTNAVSQRSEFILLTSEIQDNTWAGKIPRDGYGSLAESKTKMLVDYVRVYQLPDRQP